MLDEPFSALDEYLRWNLEQELLEVLRLLRSGIVCVAQQG